MTRSGAYLVLTGLAGFALAMLTLRPLRKCADGHDLERHWTGGHRCRRCGKAIADFGEAGTMSDGYVDKRTQYGREPGQGVTRDWFLQ